MPFHALQLWESSRAAALDEIEQAHLAVGGVQRGRRYATQQINHAYAMLLSSQFQGFCRDLHTESIDHIAGVVPTVPLQALFNLALHRSRKLDHGNPNPGNLGSDFGQLLQPGVRLWDLVYQADARSPTRRAYLQDLCDWRNAIAHQDFSDVGGTFLGKGTVQQWRSSCNGLARTFDSVLQASVAGVTGTTPW